MPIVKKDLIYFSLLTAIIGLLIWLILKPKHDTIIYKAFAIHTVDTHYKWLPKNEYTINNQYFYYDTNIALYPDTNLNRARVYSDSTGDSNVKIHATTTVQGFLLKSHLTWQVRERTIIIKDSSGWYKQEPKKAKLFLTASGQIANAEFNPAIGVNYITRKEVMYFYQYGFTSNSHQIGIGLNLFSLKDYFK